MKRFCFLTWLFVLGLFLPLPAQENEDASIIFCAYNLKNYLKMDRFVAGTRTAGVPKPEAEIEHIIRFLTEIKPDVLGVSEIGVEEDLQDLQKRLKAAGIDLPHMEHSQGGDHVRFLGLLSRFPITARDSQENLSYPIGDQVFPMQRGILDATVAVRDDFPLRLMGVHFKSKREIPEADQALMRRNEAHLLRKHVTNVLQTQPDTKLLVYGDFNEYAHEAPIVEIKGTYGNELSLLDIKVLDSRQQSWTHYWSYADVYSRLDYIFVNRALLSHLNRAGSYIYDTPDYEKGSDHRPLVLKINVTPRN